ncbi:hypothetical protein BMMGA3_17275 (plasmid) [Bacillus methanolicus MGA3]|uniref:Uncharacterized protein n=1 Tax=Bacillus methanolicus (strain MGA3 / ATCC 53907) TaxID=796606 RepID=A0A068M239_BACMM|nr:hypothetical protein BMMGA3_17275 [Bacillus methanolicus MGA3]
MSKNKNDSIKNPFGLLHVIIYISFRNFKTNSDGLSHSYLHHQPPYYNQQPKILQTSTSKIILIFSSPHNRLFS